MRCAPKGRIVFFVEVFQLVTISDFRIALLVTFVFHRDVFSTFINLKNHEEKIT